ILARGNASQEHRLDLTLGRVEQLPNVAAKRVRVARVATVDVALGHLAQVVNHDGRIDRNQAAVGGDGEGPYRVRWRRGERRRVQELSAEVQAAEEAEDLADAR